MQFRSPCPPVAPLIFAVANDQEDDEYQDDGQGGDSRAENCPVELDRRISRLGDGLLGPVSYTHLTLPTTPYV